MFKFGRLIGGLFGQIKMIIILFTVISVLGYLQATRSDAKKAAAASIEIDQLVRVNKLNNRRLKIQQDLSKKHEKQSAKNQKKITQAENKARVERKRIESIKPKGDGKWCPVDCSVPQ